MSHKSKKSASDPKQISEVGAPQSYQHSKLITVTTWDMMSIPTS